MWNKLKVDFNTFFDTTSTVEQHFNETYELHHLLGQGGFAVVYSGTRVRDNLPVSKSLSFFLFFLSINFKFYADIKFYRNQGLLLKPQELS